MLFFRHDLSCQEDGKQNAEHLKKNEFFIHYMYEVIAYLAEH